ncbi:M67 family metallopeptidase [Novosphingobium sp. ERN07]|uniref:Mov34/MPN/PAD-1 family protein n=1 Tax=Novosphingobium sp. ERN07 TaxID=2726187 RepID=UPI001456FD4A|nr:M67 family metallopeptidase [Novosphingobium sp. ERN07]NLR73357.1 M67 family metallopeptidase [Novosphingobium sp. ERN07]
MALIISQSAHAAMLDAAHRAAPREACGLLLGTATRIETAVPTANAAADPFRHFEIDPAALIAAHRAARDGSTPQVIGYFHSHPNGIARPSATDTASAARDGRIWVIVADNAITCWRDGADGFEPLSYCVEQG